MSSQDAPGAPQTSGGAEPSPPPTIATRYRYALLREPSPEYEHVRPCKTPTEAAAFVRQMLADWDREVVGAVLMNQQHRAIGHVIAYIGTQVRTLVEPRGVLVPALLANAAGIILFHNHPGGSAWPSAEDKAFCERLTQAGGIVGVELVDSLIVTPEGAWMSMRELGMVTEGSDSKD